MTVLHTTEISRCQLVVADELLLDRFVTDSAAVTHAFIHSANYKFSLGSGSSFIVRCIIDAEREAHGRSRLERAIRRIRKTPPGEVRVTDGGELGPSFTLQGVREETYPNFDHIVHLVLSGPRASRFKPRVEAMLYNALDQVALLMEGTNNAVDLCLPIIGVNNFGYPLDFMCALYVRLLREWTSRPGISGRVVLWLRADHLSTFEENLC